MTKKNLSDNYGTIEVDTNKLWGIQTQRSLKFFDIGDDLFDREFIMAMINLKVAMAKANNLHGLLDQERADLIVEAAQLIIKDNDFAHFPVKIWQTGSGTQLNMNVNEVLANKAMEIAKSDIVIHPNDHVNMSQSSNDTIPNALNISSANLAMNKLLPALNALEKSLDKKVEEFKEIIKIGRTHMMDAVPMSLGQEFSAYKYQIKDNIKRLTDFLSDTAILPIGGTAVGSGLNCPSIVADECADLLGKIYGIKFKRMENLFSGVAASDFVVALSGNLKTLACSLQKMANDLIFLASGPDSGLNELQMPQNEPGSSIMPGKVNPTQCEAMTMVCCQVIGNDLAISMGGMQGRLQLNTFRPLLIRNIHHSLHILSDCITSFDQFCIQGLSPNLKSLERGVSRSKMIVTAVAPFVGYAKATELVKLAQANGTTIKEEVLKSGVMSEAEYDSKVKLTSLIHPPKLEELKKK